MLTCKNRADKRAAPRPAAVALDGAGPGRHDAAFSRREAAPGGAGMAIIVSGTRRAEATAKWLRGLSEREGGIRRMTLGAARDAVAAMLGHADWAALERACPPGAEPSPPDHALAAGDRRARRLAQAEALARSGAKGAAALAAVDILLPSGDLDHEYEECHRFMAAHAESELDPAAPEAGWLAHLYGLAPGEAAALAKARGALGEPLREALRRWAPAAARRRSVGSDGYAAVVIEKDLFWQGFFLAPPPPWLEPEVAAAEARTREVVRAASGGPGAAERWLDALREGRTPLPLSYEGALEACLADVARRPGGDKGVLIFGHLLRQAVGADFFVVFAEVGKGGTTTSLRPLRATSAAEAKAAIDALPEVRRIKARLIRLHTGRR
jgi:hypothetical protein